MKNTKITQEHVDKYLATTEEFWRSFYDALKDPNNQFSGFKDDSFERWTEYCWNVSEIKKNLQKLFGFPLLKNEYLVRYQKEFMQFPQMLTNYRLIIKDERLGIQSIPLSKLKKLNEEGDGEFIFEKDGQDFTIHLKTSIHPDFIKVAKSKLNQVDFNDYQLFFLENSLQDLNQSHPDLNIPEVNMYTIIEEKRRKAKGLNKDQIVFTSYKTIAENPKLTLLVTIVLLIMIIGSFGGNSYDIIEKKNGVVIAETELEYELYDSFVIDLAEIVWGIADKYNDYDKIKLNVTLNGKNMYGKDMSRDLSTYTMDKDHIKKINLYEKDNFVYLSGQEYIKAYLRRNGVRK